MSMPIPFLTNNNFPYDLIETVLTTSALNTKNNSQLFSLHFYPWRITCTRVPSYHFVWNLSNVICQGRPVPNCTGFAVSSGPLSFFYRIRQLIAWACKAHTCLTSLRSFEQECWAECRWLEHDWHGRQHHYSVGLDRTLGTWGFRCSMGIDCVVALAY